MRKKNKKAEIIDNKEVDDTVEKNTDTVEKNTDTVADNTDTVADNTDTVTENATVTENTDAVSESADSPSESSKKKKRERRERTRAGGLRSAFSLSIILYALDLLTDAVYERIIKGFFGRIFTAYPAEQAAFEKGAVNGFAHGSGRFENWQYRLRAKLSRAFESSFILGKLGEGLRFLLFTPLKLYGSFCLTFGFYSAAVFFIRQIFPSFVPLDSASFFVSLGAILVAIPLSLSKESLCTAFGRGRISRLLFVDAFGFKEEDFIAREVKQKRKRVNLSVLLGMLFGLSTFFVYPVFFPITLLLLVSVAIIIITPEIGVIITIFAIPFFSLGESPTLLLALFVAVSVFGYIIKLIRGKRILKIELLDVAVALFGLTLYMSGAISAGGRASFATAGMAAALMLGYFLTVNTMRSARWLGRCVNALVSSSVIVSLLGILQYFTGHATLGWIDTDMFSDLNGRVTSLFDNPNVLAFYLVMTLPLCLAKLGEASDARGRMLALLSSAAVAVCIVLTWSRGAWVAVIVSILLFGLINSRKTLKALVAVALALPFAAYLVPSSVMNRFTSIGSMADSSTYYRVYTWRGTLRAIGEYLWGGVGYGSAAYTEIYPQFAYAGIEAAEHSHSLYLELLFSTGIFGTLIFAVVIFLFAQKSFEYFGTAKDRSVKLMASAAFCGVAGALVVGLFDFVWYNLRLFYVFWILMALCSAYVRFGKREEIRFAGREEYGSESAVLDIIKTRKGGIGK